MLVNLCGPPASGKSLYATNFVLSYPEFELISIDDLRREHQEEEEAWYQLMIGAVNTEHCIVETSGLSWHLDAHVLSQPNIMKRGILTIILYGQEEDFIDRLKERKKPEIPFKYKGLTQKNLIRKTLEELPERYPTAYFLKTDNSTHKEKNYKEFEKVILSYKKKIDEYLVK